MPTGNGIVADTPISLAIGAGVFLKDHAFVGPTTENNLFAIERELFTPQLNGIMWDLKGTDYIIRSVPRIEATLPSINANVLETHLPGIDVNTSTPGMVILDDSGERRIDDSDYHDYELDLERPNGGQFQFEVDDAINTGSFEGELQDDGLFAPRVIATGRGNAADSEASPWRIRLLDTAS